MKSQTAKDIDSYIDSQPESIQPKLEELRQLITSVEPNMSEVISYQMPAFKLNKVIVYFAGCKNHIGFYPSGSGITAFEKELTGFSYSKGAIQFPLDKPLPVSLIKKIVKYRVNQDKEAAALKLKKQVKSK